MKKTRFLSLALTSTLCVSLLAGCGGSGDDGGAAQTPDAANTSAIRENTSFAFKLGGTGSLTGDAAIYGLAAQRGAQIAVGEIRETDGNTQFALKYKDGANVPKTAVSAYSALKEWGMQISLGSVASQPGVGTSILAFEDRVFIIAPSGSSPDIISGKDSVYQMCLSDPNQGLASAQCIAEQGPGERVFIIWKNDDVYSTNTKEQFVKEARTPGLEAVGDVTFTTDTATDFSVQLTQAQQAGADLVFLPIYYQPASLILSQTDTTGYTPTFFGVDGIDGVLTMDGFNVSLAEGAMLLTPFNASATDGAAVNFMTKYQELYGETPNQFAADAYDCVYTYKMALEAAGCTPDMSSEELCDALIATFPTVTLTDLTDDGAGTTWDASGEVSKSPKGMVIENGAYAGMNWASAPAFTKHGSGGVAGTAGGPPANYLHRTNG